MGPDAAVVQPHGELPGRQRVCLAVLSEVLRVLSQAGVNFCLIGGGAVYAHIEEWIRGAARPPLHHRGSIDVDVALPEPTPEAADRAFESLAEAGYDPTDEPWRLACLIGGSSFPVDLMAVPPPRHSVLPIPVGTRMLAPFWNGEAALRRPRMFSFPGASAHVASAEGLVRAKLLACFARDLRPEEREKHAYDVFALARTCPGCGRPRVATLTCWSRRRS